MTIYMENTCLIHEEIEVILELVLDDVPALAQAEGQIRSLKASIDKSDDIHRQAIPAIEPAHTALANNGKQSTPLQEEGFRNARALPTCTPCSDRRNRRSTPWSCQQP